MAAIRRHHCLEPHPRPVVAAALSCIKRTNAASQPATGYRTDLVWLRRVDSNHRPAGYEPTEMTTSLLHLTCAYLRCGKVPGGDLLALPAGPIQRPSSSETGRWLIRANGAGRRCALIRVPPDGHGGNGTGTVEFCVGLSPPSPAPPGQVSGRYPVHSYSYPWDLASPRLRIGMLPSGTPSPGSVVIPSTQRQWQRVPAKFR